MYNKTVAAKKDIKKEHAENGRTLKNDPRLCKIGNENFSVKVWAKPSMLRKM